MNELVTFTQKNIAKVGNDFMKVVLVNEVMREDAERTVVETKQRDALVDFELTRVVMMLHKKDAINAHDIFSANKQDSATLYKMILKEIGVYKRVDVGTTFEFQYTDPDVEAALSWKEKIASYKFDKEKEEKPKYTDDEISQHRACRSRRNGLNLRLSRCCKAACALLDADAEATDLVYVDEKPVLKKGPVEVMGKEEKVIVHTGLGASKADGAKIIPTVSALAKFAKDKEDKPAASKSEIETTADPTTGEASTIVSEQDFLAMASAMLMAVKRREGKFTDAEATVLRNLKDIL